VSAIKELPKRAESRPRAPSGSPRRYLQSLGLVAVATLFAQALHQLSSPTTLVMVYLLCVVIAAILWGLGPSILVSVVGVIAFDFFFIGPAFSFTNPDAEYFFTFVVLLLVGLIISYLMERVRRQAEATSHRERQTAALYALGRELAVSISLDSYVHAIVSRSRETFGRDTAVYLPDPQEAGKLRRYADGQDVAVPENELAAAIWSFEHQKVVGHGTDTLPNAKARYVPLVTARGSVGVMAISADGLEPDLTIEQERLLAAYVDLAAIAIESILLGEEARNVEVLRETERLQTALLNSVSHDLRTPLVSIIGVLSSLQEEGMKLDDAAKRNLLQVAREEAERLNHLIANLLDVSRIEAGAIKICTQPSYVQDLVGAALQQLAGRANSREVRIRAPQDLPMVSVDFALMVQTLVNVLDNALRYSPTDSPIEINAHQVSNEVHIEIADRGSGIPEQDLLRVFDKFYRIQRPGNVAGTGLGLSICKGIIEAHRGHIAAENRPGGGTLIRLTLPTAEQKQEAGNASGG